MQAQSEAMWCAQELLTEVAAASAECEGLELQLREEECSGELQDLKADLARSRVVVAQLKELQASNARLEARLRQAELDRDLAVQRADEMQRAAEQRAAERDAVLARS
jgi:hypothetical protein